MFGIICRKFMIAVLGIMLVLNSGYANQTQRNRENIWQTDQGKLLDSPVFLNKLIEIKSGETAAERKNPVDLNMASERILKFLFSEISDVSKGKGISAVRIETLLSALGAVTGFSIQMAGRETFIETGEAKQSDIFQEIITEDGQKFYIGDFINQPLTMAKPVNIWSMVAGAVQASGSKKLPDINEIFLHKGKTLGSDQYGQLTVHNAFRPDQSPQELLNKYYNPIRNLLYLDTRILCSGPSFWGTQHKK